LAGSRQLTCPGLVSFRHHLSLEIEHAWKIHNPTAGFKLFYVLIEKQPKPILKASAAAKAGISERCGRRIEVGDLQNNQITKTLHTRGRSL